jgi:CPA2 family monovalent cation:H+ antiporter-2
VEISEVIFPVLLMLTLGIATVVLSRMVKVNPIVGYPFLGMVVSAVRPELVTSWADRRAWITSPLVP